MPDSIVAASVVDAAIAVAAAITTDLVEEIRGRHDLWPTATAAVGRLTTGAALFAANLKGNERISLQIAGDGPLGTLAADAWLLDAETIGARGYARNGRVELPIDARGKFNVAAAVGAGALQVTRSSEVGQPYVGVVPLRVGRDRRRSRRLPRAVRTDSQRRRSRRARESRRRRRGRAASSRRCCPGPTTVRAKRSNERAAAMPPVTQLIAAGRRRRRARAPRSYGGRRAAGAAHASPCSLPAAAIAPSVESVLLGLGAEELLALTRERDRTEATCEYCKTRYEFDADELRELAQRTTPAEGSA